ncbi:hypothetical protein TYRP_019282 [Tyrophagus putrescentiae]|nr:hypothetical protein TYRP_019282 [Tyrophagus putrescentiae]
MLLLQEGLAARQIHLVLVLDTLETAVAAVFVSANNSSSTTTTSNHMIDDDDEEQKTSVFS